MLSVFFLGVGVLVCINAYLLGLGTFREPGPGFIFMLFGFLFTIFSLMDVLKGARKARSNKLDFSGLRWRKVIWVLVLLSAYIFSLERVGFLISSFLFLLFLFKVVEPTKWWISIVSSFTAVLVSYAIFNLWLKVPFPIGFLRL